MFTNMKASIVRFFKEMKLQLTIRFKMGRRELSIYRIERDHGMSILWVPSKKRWVRARALRWWQKNVLVRFVDGAEKEGYRSPLSIRERSPRRCGSDKPYVDARYSGLGRDLFGLTWDPHPPSLSAYGATIEEVNAAIATLTGVSHG